MPYPFGVSFPYTFYPILNDQPVRLPSQTANLHVFEDMPSRSAALAGTGALGSYSATVPANATNVTFTLDAIEDPDVTADEGSATYFVAIVYKLQASGQDQVIVRALEIERVKAHHKTLSIGAADLEAVWKAATTYASGSDISTKVATCTDELKAELRDKGYEWAAIWRPDRLRNVLVHRVLSGIALEQMQEANDAFQALADRFSETATRLLSSLKLELGEQEPKAEVKQASMGVMLYSK